MSATKTDPEAGVPPAAAAPLPEPIPPTRGERSELLRISRDYVRSRDLVPPLSLDELRDHTRRVVALAGNGGAYADFITVLISNETWRERLAAVPYERRLLLLPQCLRRKSTCAGVLDEYGLLCGNCGGCDIANLQAEAEALGYAVLVAEGTSVVMKLIEAGRIDGVVGVSCLSVLERTFPRMGAGAVPGIAIPLLRNGCADTAVDRDWVQEAIRARGTGARPALDLEALQEEVRGWFFAAALNEVLGPAETGAETISRTWLAKSGKRWRPFLVAATFQALHPPERGKGNPLLADLRRLAVAVECFHKASLIHDDIEDGDPERYGERTLHMEYNVPIALNAGDLLLGDGYRLIAETAAPPERRNEMLRTAAAGHHALCVGQGKELGWAYFPGPLGVEEVLDIFRGKTAPAFRVALRLGAIHAGADAEVCAVLDAYSDHLGVAYQIRDDLDDLRETGSGDLSSALPSLFMALAHENSRGRARDVVEGVWRRRIPFRDAQAELETVFADLRIEEQMRRMLKDYEQRAVASLRPLRNADLKCFLRRIIDKIFGVL